MLDLTGKTILITSGPTYAFIDAVRVISNRSSGRLGSTIASHVNRAGANTIQLAGENSITAKNIDHNTTVNIQTFGTVEDFKQKIKHSINLHSPDFILMAAAVLDYIPSDVNQGKKNSQDVEWTIKLKKNEKIIEQIKQWSPTSTLIGFKLETKINIDELAHRALDLINRSGAKMVVANLLEDINATEHTAYFIEKDQQNNAANVSVPYHSPDDIALALCEYIYKHQ